MFLDAPGEPFLFQPASHVGGSRRPRDRVVRAVLLRSGWTVPVVAFEVAPIVAAEPSGDAPVDGDLNGGSCGTRSREFTDQGVID